ncbi:MAG: hypothetical protein H8E12_17240 [Rhodobacteraceae bacterium]|nr:hypothetical protein [Paracoccaceae bacterium]
MKTMKDVETRRFPHWNYRIVSKEVGQFIQFGIHEVYYWPDQSVRFVSVESINPWGETFEDLRVNMHQMAEAFHRPTLEWDHAWDEE